MPIPVSIIAYKAKYSFADTSEKAERYRDFLRQHILELSPKYYGVTDVQRVLTPDGVMYAIRLAPELADPSYEVIAECLINNVHIYLWRDACWMIAIDKRRNLIVKSKLSQYVKNTDEPITKIEHDHVKTMIIFEIGESCKATPQ